MAEVEGEEGSFPSDLRALLESGSGTDTLLVAGSAQLSAHSQILAARSAVLAAMLRESSSRRLEIAGVREAVLRQLVSFIYTDAAPELESVAPELLAAADRFQLPLLKRRCEQHMRRDIGVHNAAATAALAVQHGCPALTTAAVQFVAAHPEVLATDGWARLLRDSAEAAVEVSRQLAQLLQQEPPAETKRVAFADEQQNAAHRLTEAAAFGHVEEVREQLAAGAPIDGNDGRGNTALHLAVLKKRAETVKCLLDAGADVTATDSCLQTPLHCAAVAFDVKIMCMLVGASVPLDPQDRWGKTPLHWAAETNAQAVKALLLAGAKEDVKNYFGKIPAEVSISVTRPLFNI